MHTTATTKAMICSIRITLFLATVIASWCGHVSGQNKIYQQIQDIPSLIECNFSYNYCDSIFTCQSFGTCFFIEVFCDTTLIDNYLITNSHVFAFRDSSRNIRLQSDTGRVFINVHDDSSGRDTVVMGFVKVFARRDDLDIVLAQCTVEIPRGGTAKMRFPKLDIKSPPPDPIPGELIAYCGFPLLLGADTARLRKNLPLIIKGSVAQSSMPEPDFIIQAPTFPGASGSPVLSLESGQLLGVTRAVVPRDKSAGLAYESFQYAVKSSQIAKWIADGIPRQLLEARCRGNK